MSESEEHLWALAPHSYLRHAASGRRGRAFRETASRTLS